MNDVSCLMPYDDAVCKIRLNSSGGTRNWTKFGRRRRPRSSRCRKRKVEETAKEVEAKEEALNEAEKTEKQAKVEDFVGKLAEKIKDVGLDEKENRSPEPDEAESKVAEEKSNPEKPALVNADNAQTS